MAAWIPDNKKKIKETMFIVNNRQLLLNMKQKINANEKKAFIVDIKNKFQKKILKGTQSLRLIFLY